MYLIQRINHFGELRWWLGTHWTAERIAAQRFLTERDAREFMVNTGIAQAPRARGYAIVKETTCTS